jgi:hypothetical protein
VDATLGIGDSLENGDGFGPDPFGQGAGFDQVTDVGEAAFAVMAVSGFVTGVVVGARSISGRPLAVLVIVTITVVMSVRMGMTCAIRVNVFVGVGI